MNVLPTNMSVKHTASNYVALLSSLPWLQFLIDCKWWSKTGAEEGLGARLPILFFKRDPSTMACSECSSIGRYFKRNSQTRWLEDQHHTGNTHPCINEKPNKLWIYSVKEGWQWCIKSYGFCTYPWVSQLVADNSSSVVIPAPVTEGVPGLIWTDLQRPLQWYSAVWQSDTARLTLH